MTSPFQPWKDFAQDQELLPIFEPPCKNCVYWKPHRQYEAGGKFSGVVLCNKVGEQCNDFSCFQERRS